MEIEIIHQNENSLLKRTEVEFKVTHDKKETPTRGTVAAKLAAMMNTDRNMTIIKKIETQFGLNMSLGYANIYKDEQSISVEPKFIMKRNQLLEEETE